MSEQRNATADRERFMSEDYSDTADRLEAACEAGLWWIAEAERLRAENAELKRQLGDALVATHNTVATLRGELMRAQASPAEWRNGRNCMESSRTLLEKWVSAHSWAREVWIGFMSGWRVELASNSTQLQFMLVVYDRPQLAQPIVNERYHEVYLGTSESPASLDDVILAALAKWEELHGS